MAINTKQFWNKTWSNEHERKYTAESLADLVGKYFKKYEVYDINNYLLIIAEN